MPESWLEEVEEFWSARERFLKSDASSPLKAEERKKFLGLKYFPPDPAFKLKARFVRAPESRVVELQTSKGGSVRIAIAGELYFTIGKIQFKLLAYKGKGSNLLVPFRDKTNGSETFSLGRYVEVEAPEGAEILTLDFNLAYNPDAAYEESKESLVPPAENSLDLAIRAGEKNYYAQSVR
ncbi:MAG: DUF1684 domain-containing protein [Conexivisphaerales archaeon]